MAMPKKSDEVMQEFLERVSGGESVRSVVKDPKMPGWSTVSRRIASDPDFEKQYRLALEFRGMMLVDELDDIKHNVQAGMIDPAATRVAADILKWQGARMTPRIYGDRQQIDVAPAQGGSYLEALTKVNDAITNRRKEVLLEERETQPNTLHAHEDKPKSS